MPLSKKTQRFWQFSLLAIVVFAVVGLRGFFLAFMIKGSYRLSTFLIDAGCAVLIMGLLQLFDFGITRGLKKLFTDQTRTRRVTAKVVRLAIVLGIAGPLVLTTAQLHPPKISCAGTPADIGLEFASHQIKTDDGVKLAVWRIPAEHDEAAVVVLAHGLGANKQNFLPVAWMLQKIGYHVVAFDFRAHGDSQGHTCSLGVHEARDVKAAYDFAKTEFPERPIYAWATSMGGAATMRATNEYDIFDKVVVDATFANVKSVAINTKLGYLGPLDQTAWQLCRAWYAAWIGLDIQQYGPIKDIREISHCPILLIHGTGDNMIPSSESESLHAASPSAELWLIEGAGHNGAMHDGNYPQRLRSFYETGNATSQRNFAGTE